MPNNQINYITPEEYTALLKHSLKYKGFVIGVGYAYITTAAIPPPTMDILNPPKFVPHGMDHYQHLKVQCLNTSDEAIELNLKGNPEIDKDDKVEEANSNGGTLARDLTIMGLGLAGDITESRALAAFNKQAANWLYAEKFYGTVETGWTSANPKMLKLSNSGKWLGRSMIGLSAGISLYEGVDALVDGNTDKAMRSGLDLGVGLGTAWIGGPAGVIIYLLYMGAMQTPPGNPNGYVTPLCAPDKTYVAPPIFQGS